MAQQAALGNYVEIASLRFLGIASKYCAEVNRRPISVSKPRTINKGHLVPSKTNTLQPRAQGSQIGLTNNSKEHSEGNVLIQKCFKGFEEDNGDSIIQHALPKHKVVQEWWCIKLLED